MSRAITRHQHLSPHRKHLLRKHLLRWAIPGACYLPFCGDADVACGGREGVLEHEKYPCPGLYLDRFIFGADLDEARVNVARDRIPNGDIRVSDCDLWPFHQIDTGPIAIADFDAWAEPWPSFRSFWEYSEKADRLVMFFTDAHRMGVMVDGTHVHPDGSTTTIESLSERRSTFNFYLQRTIWPYLTETLAKDGFRIIDRAFYLRGFLAYYGVVAEHESYDHPGMIR